MCPLIAPNGSPWTREKNGKCPEHDKIDHGGCTWFTIACGVGGIHHEVDMAFKNQGLAFVIGPNRPKKMLGKEKTYDCQREHECSWQKHCKHESGLCGPRYAISKGMDPRVCLF